MRGKLGCLFPGELEEEEDERVRVRSEREEGMSVASSAATSEHRMGERKVVSWVVRCEK